MERVNILKPLNVTQFMELVERFKSQDSSSEEKKEIAASIASAVTSGYYDLDELGIERQDLEKHLSKPLF